MSTIDRLGFVQHALRLLRDFPVVAILGARQVGKTTLAGQIAKATKLGTTRFDLERPSDVARLADAEGSLGPLKGLIVLDEIQRRPELFPVLRVLADRKPLPARFLVLGSASPDLLRQSSESLAGRIAYLELDGFSLAEVGVSQADRLWVRGGFPRSFVARDEATSFRWRAEFVTTYLEHSLAQFDVRMPAEALRRLWTMIAHLHGSVLNTSQLAQSFGVADTTVRRWIEMLRSLFVVRMLKPWHENVGKRQVKAPKVYVSDSGLLHALLSIETKDELFSHPKLGASWEGFAISTVVDALHARADEVTFWGTHAGAELDLLVVRGKKRLGFEFKRTTAPSVTKSMHVAQDTLGLTSLDVVHAGNETFPLGKGIRAVALTDVLSVVKPLRTG